MCREAAAGPRIDTVKGNSSNQTESLKSQQATVRAQLQEQPITLVDFITSKQYPLPTRGNYRNNDRPSTVDKLDSHCGWCGWCGRAFHSVSQCPAKDAICWKCQKKGQFQHMYRSKSVAAVSVECGRLNTDLRN